MAMLFTRGSSVKRAAEYLVARIEQARTAGDVRLPGVRELASGAGVSTRTLWKALAAFRRDGVVAVIPGGGIFLSQSATGTLDDRVFAFQDLMPRQRVPRAEQVRRLLSEDLLAGHFAPGTVLPGYKELRHRYGVCYLTLRTALTRLAAERRVEPYGKGYRVPQTPVQSGRPLIVHVYSRHLGATHGLVHAHPFSWQFWGQVEKQRVRLNIDVELVHQDAALGVTPGSGSELDKRVAGRTVLGCMISTLVLSDDELDSLFLEVNRRRWRTAVLIEGTGPAIGRVHLRNPLLRFFTLAGGSKAGEIIANFLLRLGHRHIAVVSSSARSQFGIRRIEGMRRVLEAAGGCSLEVFDATIENWESVALRDPVHRAFQRSVARYERETTPPYEAESNVFSREAALHMRAQFLKSHLIPYLGRALENKAITAWTTITDVEGLTALSYLRGTGVAVPGRISLASFDNTVDSFGQGLTSYDFNVPSIVQAMFDHILEPRRSLARGQMIVEIPGMVMARQSTGPAPVGQNA